MHRNPSTHRLIHVLLGLLCLLFMASGHSQERPVLTVVSEPWENATNPDGTGLYWDILRAIYHPEGYQLRVETAPYLRAAGLVKLGKVDVMVGAYAGEIEGVIYPDEPFDIDRIYAVSMKARKDLPEDAGWRGEKSLHQRIVGYIKGYALAKYLDESFYAQELYDRKVILRMLINHRLDYYIDGRDEILVAMKENHLESEQFRQQPVKSLPLYFTFQATEQGQALAALHDRQLRHLKETGQLRQLFEQWDEIYPFAESPD